MYDIERDESSGLKRSRREESGTERKESSDWKRFCHHSFDDIRF
jgi:hypothetical protein